MDKIGGFILRNEGGFDCASKVIYDDHNGDSGTTDRWDMISVGQQQNVAPSDKGVIAGASIQLYIDIAGGNDRTGGTDFRYGPDSHDYAQYTIRGTTFDSDVEYDGIVPG